MLLGIVAFGIAAAQTASEYSLGTLRQLLVRQPRRVTLLVGKMLGVITFLLLAFVFAAVVAFVVAIVVAHARHGSTTAWFTGTGLGDLFRALGDIALAVVGYSVLGLGDRPVLPLGGVRGHPGPRLDDRHREHHHPHRARHREVAARRAARDGRDRRRRGRELSPPPAPRTPCAAEKPTSRVVAQPTMRTALPGQTSLRRGS